MAIVISVFLQKGGSGKTTTALNFCAIAGKRKHKILLIDMDEQANATFSSGVENPKYTIEDVLTNTCNINKAIIKCKYYDLIASDEDLSMAEIGDDSTLLKRKLLEIEKDYEYIVLDCPPSKNDLTANALIASNTLIVPVEPSMYCFTGLQNLSRVITKIHKSHLNDELSILGVLLVKSKPRTTLNKQMGKYLDKAVKKMGTTLFDCSIRDCVVIPTCAALQIPLPDYTPKTNNAAMDYNGFVTKALERLEAL